MYSFLSQFIKPAAAGVVTACWYTGLVLLVLYYLVLPSGQFRYAHW